MAIINVREPGLQTTIQDMGRPEHQIDGFPESGSLDQPAAKLANWLVANDANQPLLEFSLTGPTLVFDSSTFVALTGGQFAAQVNGKPLPAYQCVQVHSGDVVTIGSVTKGRIGYLAISGGLEVSPVLDSASTTLRLHLGGFHGRQLQAGDELTYSPRQTMPSYYHRSADSPKLPAKDQVTRIRVLKGPQWNDFSLADRTQFVSQQYSVTADSDRMGYRLKGDELTTKQASMLSSATVRGGIQVPTNGQPIVLLADRQTTGGYPLIAVVATVDLPKLVQCQPGQKLQFELVTLPITQQLLRQEATSQQQFKDQVAHALYRQPIGINRVASQRIEQLFEE